LGRNIENLNLLTNFYIDISIDESRCRDQEYIIEFAQNSKIKSYGH